MQHLTADDLDYIALWYVLQHSYRSFSKLLQVFSHPAAALSLSAYDTWQDLRLDARHLARLQKFHTAQGQQDFSAMLQILRQTADHILFQHSPHYPEILLPYDDRPPILLVQGSADVLSQPQIAMVGSRKLSPYGQQMAYDFAYYLAEKGYVITSGLALGIDAASHQGAVQIGQSIAVIATGLDKCYPQEHQGLWQRIVQTGGAVISEFLPQTAPIKGHFPRRNRIISALSQGTLIVEAGLQSGSLITAKTAVDQGKQVFAIPGHIYSPHHQGCHQLIREGATLVDHPQQIIDDLTAFGSTPQPKKMTDSAHTTTPNSSKISSNPDTQTATDIATTAKNTATTPDVPQHLQAVFAQLDWNGISLDDLALRLNQDISSLNICLVELELLGLCKQHAGRYLRNG